MLASDHFMDGWEARHEALNASDSKDRNRILKDHRVAVALVERVMAQLHDASSESLRIEYLVLEYRHYA